MGQTIFSGYATTPPVVYVPCEPLEPVITDNTANPAAPTASDKLASSARRRSSINRKHTAEDERKLSGGVGGADDKDNGDGEWMYNLDSLADEHKKRAKKK